MFCKNCGAQLTGTENNCPNCGNPVVKENKPVGTEPISATSAPAPNPFIVQPAPVEEPKAPEGPVLPVEPSQLAQVMENQTIPEPPAMPEATPQPQTLDQTLNQPTVQPQQTPVVPSAPEPAPVVAPVMPGTNPQPAAPQVQAQPMPQPMAPGMAPQPTAPATPDNKNSGAKTAVIIGGVFLLAIVIVSTLTGLFSGGGSTENPSGGSASTKDYAGYIFNVPANYSATILGNDLMVDSSERGFIINLDYTNSYELYKEYYTIKYQDVNGDAINTIGGREYMIFRFSDSSGREISEFFTKLEATVTLAGVITHRDGSTVTKSDYESLSNLLSTIQKSNITVQKGDTLDSGKEGYIDFSARKLNFFR